MGCFNQKIWLSLPTIQLTVYLSVIYFNLSPVNAGYVYSLPNAKYSPHHYYNSVPTMPKNMQLRRFMWSNEHSGGDFYKDITSGAHVMRQMGSLVPMMGSLVKPSIMKFKNYFQPHTSPSNHIKYIVRKPKKIVHIKKVIPKKIIKIMTIPTLPQPTKPLPTKPLPTKPSEYKFNLDKDKYINPDHDHITPKDTLRMIEEEEERRVEATISALFPINNHGTSSSGGSDYNIVSGKIEEFDDSWKPIRIDIENTEQPKRSYPISQLHINVDDYVNLKNDKKIEKSPSYEVTDINLKNEKNFEKLPYNDINNVYKKNEKKIEKLPYEVTEISAEESMQLPQAFKLKKIETNRFTKENVITTSRSSGTSSLSSVNSIRSRSIGSTSTSTSSTSTTTTTEKPNYPDYYLETFPRDYQVDCATKTPLIWKNTSKKDASSMIVQPIKEQKIENITKSKKQRQTNIQSVTTEKQVKLKPMRKYSSKIKKQKFRSTIKPQIKTDESIDIKPEIHKFVTIKDEINDIQTIPTAFTTRIPDDLFRYITTTSTSTPPPSTTITNRSKLNKFDKERIKKLRGAKKYGENERYTN